MKYILISSLLFMFTACSEVVYETMNSHVVEQCKKNPNVNERRECEHNKQRTFSEYKKEIKTNENEL